MCAHRQEKSVCKKVLQKITAKKGRQNPSPLEAAAKFRELAMSIRPDLDLNLVRVGHLGTTCSK